MSFVAALIQGLVEPARQLGLPSVPKSLLDALAPVRVGGRRAWSDGERAAIEAGGLNRPGSEERIRALEQGLERHPGVLWARVNAPLGRVIIGLGPEPASLEDLVAAVDAIEPGEGAGANVGRPLMGPGDTSAVADAASALAADVAGLAVAGAARLMDVSPVLTRAAAAVSVVDSFPRLRGVMEAALGQPAADTAIAVANAGAQALAQGIVGLGVDCAQRVLTLAEASAEAQAWASHRGRYLGSPEVAAASPLVVERPAALLPGPVEEWADRAGALAVATFGVAFPATGSAGASAGLALAALPKAARAGREGFATVLGRTLARRGALITDPGALRRLDRVETVVLDAEVLSTGRFLPETVIALAGADPSAVAANLHGLFHHEAPTTVTRSGGWSLGPVADLSLTGRKGVRERRRLEAAGYQDVLGLAEGNRLMAVAGIAPEVHESLEALAAASHRSGRRLVVAGSGGTAVSTLADSLMPGGARLLGTVMELQSHGRGVLVLSRNRAALANADVGVGVDDQHGVPAWGAHILVGDDLALAALVIRACGTAEAMSRRSAHFAQAGTGLGAVASTAGSGNATAPRSILAVNSCAGLSLVLGAWSATELARQPLTPPISRVPWHAMPAQVVLTRLESSPDGLVAGQVRSRRRQAGESTMSSPSLVGAVIAELDNPLTPILGAGAAVSAAIGAGVDAALVAGVTLLSALIGGIQRRGTDKALTELLTLSSVTARVRRYGEETVLPAEELVPGDIIVLGAGDVLPADCRIVASTACQVDESSLTGEPFPVEKSPDAVIAETVAERTSMLYEGTTIAAGRAVAVVVATGTSTEAGRSIAATHGGTGTGGVEARLAVITNVTLPITLASAVAVVAAGLARGKSFAATAGAGVSLAVAAVPEGLPFLVSAAQLASARRLSTEGVLVRNPRTIEALGRVNVLGFDKTGTLTQGRIALGAVTAGGGDPVPATALTEAAAEVLAAALRATPEPRRGHKLEHMTDRAVAAGARDARVSRTRGAAGWRRTGVLPFEPSRGYHATTGHDTDGTLLSVKGAPEVILARCTTLRHPGTGSTPARETLLDQAGQRRLMRAMETLAGQGYRVLAVAERRNFSEEEGKGQLTEEMVTGLTFVGFVALTDPIRPTAAASIAALRQAGIQILMITGDHPGTAAAVAGRLDLLDGGRIITGPELNSLDDDALDAILPSVTVVARGTPAHKVRVVQAFQRLNRTVAMTGDGANDAPAIRLADVGIALGKRGTPAARAAADLVVTDDRLETIISALVEGRAMWGSVREALGILVGGNLGEIAFTVFGAVLTGISPLRARQLLLVNLLTDLAPALAVALRPPHATTSDLLAEGPEASLGSALTRDIGTRALITAAGAAAAWLAAGALGLSGAAPTITLAALVGTQLAQTLTAGGMSRGVVVSGAGSMAALAAVIQSPVLSAFFGSTPLGWTGWAIAAGVSAGLVALSTTAPWIIHQLRAGTREHVQASVPAMTAGPGYTTPSDEPVTTPEPVFA